MRATGRRRGAFVAGVVLVLGAVGLLGIGGVTLFGTSTDADGAVDLGKANFQADGYAVASDSWDASADLFGTLNEVRIRVTPEDRGPIFVGVATPEQVAGYLRGVGYTNVHSKATGGPPETTHDGAAPTTPPEQADFWLAQATGAGAQTLRWPATAGDVRLVVMNADGSPLVSGSGQLTADAPALPWMGGGLLLGGLVTLAGAVLLIRRGRRTGMSH